MKKIYFESYFQNLNAIRCLKQKSLSLLREKCQGKMQEKSELSNRVATS